MMITDLNKAKDILESGRYTCVLCKGEDIITCKERGVEPLINLFDSKKDLNGFSAADKVVGNAAAFLYVLLGIKEVYAHVMSEAALQTLDERKIDCSYDFLVKDIINRTGTRICPMEEAVRGLNDPAEALYAIRQRLSEMKL